MRRAMGTVHHNRGYLTRAIALAIAATAVLTVGCSAVSPRSVPPPPGLASAPAPATSTPLYGGPAPYPVTGSGLQPPKLKRIDYPPGTLPPPMPASAAPGVTHTAPSPRGAVVAAPTFSYTAPSGFSSPVMARRPASPASLPAGGDAPWRRAVVPPESRPEAVGRMPPPASLPGFTIGAGDTVQIDVLGRPELSARSNVSGDGQITAGLLGLVAVAGLSTAQAADKLTRAYVEGGFLVSPQVTVTMVEYQSQQLTVLGEVKNPGRFPMRTRLSVLDGLALSGGINEQGASLAYLLRPEDGVVTRYEIDLDALIQFGAGQQYFELLAGDTLVVPRTQLFYIYGEVKNPNAYKLKPGMTVIQALSLAGGLTDKGSDKRIDIRRRSAGGQLDSVAVSLNEALMADDVVYVRERLF